MKKVLTFILSIMILIVPAYVYAEGEENQGNTDPGQNQQVDPQTPDPTEPEVIDNTLSSITVTGGTLSPEFNKTTYEYTITNIDPETFSISFTQSSPDKTLAPANPNGLKLDDIASKSDKTATITVTYTDTAGTQHTNTYKLTVDYEIPERSTYLSSLKVNGYELDKEFNKDTPAYSLEIPNEVDVINIIATTEDPNATITYDGGDSEIVKIKKVGEENRITVTIKNGSDTRTYYLNVLRALPKEENKEEKKEEKETEQEEEIVLEEDKKEPEYNEETKSQIEEKVSKTPNINPILNRITVTLAALVGMALGGFGIYIYVKTSPKSMKKDILKYKTSKPESSMVEVKKEEKMEIKDDLVETKEFNIDDINKDA